jgi:hypothetical protein
MAFNLRPELITLRENRFRIVNQPGPPSRPAGGRLLEKTFMLWGRLTQITSLFGT